MATKAEYAAVAKALVVAIQSDENTLVPAWARGMIPSNMAEQMANQLCTIAVDTLDAFRAKEGAS